MTATAGAEPNSEDDGAEQCVRRSRSVSPNCPCTECKAQRRRRAGQVAAGIGVGLDVRAWKVIDGLLARQWTARAIGSATGIPASTIGVALSDARQRGYRRRWGPATASAIIRHGLPDEGRIGAVGTMRRLRALACRGWSVRVLSGRCGVSHVALSKLLTGRYPRVDAKTALAVDSAYLQLEGTVGHAWLLVDRALREGWAPPEAWAGVDVDDPAVRLPGYPKADAPSTGRSGTNNAGAKKPSARGGRMAANSGVTHVPDP